MTEISSRVMRGLVKSQLNGANPFFHGIKNHTNMFRILNIRKCNLHAKQQSHPENPVYQDNPFEFLFPFKEATLSKIVL